MFQQVIQRNRSEKNEVFSEEAIFNPKVISLKLRLACIPKPSKQKEF